MFTYTKRNQEETLNFNPEELGYLYHDCKCTSVKFRKDLGDYIEELHFYPAQPKFTVLTLHKNEGKLFVESNKTMSKYPENQEELEALLK